jgi:hypothetical protein
MLLLLAGGRPLAAALPVEPAVGVVLGPGCPLPAPPRRGGGDCGCGDDNDDDNDKDDNNYTENHITENYETTANTNSGHPFDGVSLARRCDIAHLLLLKI